MSPYCFISVVLPLSRSSIRYYRITNSCRPDCAVRGLTRESCLTCVAYGSVPYGTVRYLYQSYRLRFDSLNITTSTASISWLPLNCPFPFIQLLYITCVSIYSSFLLTFTNLWYSKWPVACRCILLCGCVWRYESWLTYKYLLSTYYNYIFSHYNMNLLMDSCAAMPIYFILSSG